MVLWLTFRRPSSCQLWNPYMQGGGPHQEGELIAGIGRAVGRAESGEAQAEAEAKEVARWGGAS